MLRLKMDFIADTLELGTKLSLLFHLLFGKSIQVLLVSDFLLFLRNLNRSNILLEFTLLNTVLVFNVLQGDLSFFLQVCQLI